MGGVFEEREQDWRNGAVVYQVLVDRFAPPADPESRRAHYPPPKRLRGWSELPQHGSFLPALGLWSHEIDFWGGDLPGLTARLDHIQSLGAGVLYLNPIHHAYTNHKYDALDHAEVSPEFGTRDDLKALATALHRRDMTLVLDGVFNHMGRQAPAFQDALARLDSPYRDWFVFGPQYPGGARCWRGAENLPELNLEHPALRARLLDGPYAVLRRWLRDGADGWRLDVAFEFGPALLGAMTRAAHDEKPGSLVIGEIANYPQHWLPAVDGVLGFTVRQLLLGLAGGTLAAATAGRMLRRLVDDAGIGPMLKSWLYLDNHDTERLATALPDARRRRLAQVLQFTLPGAPCLYYGSELGMTGGADPAMRAPMRWDLVTEPPAAGSPLAWTRQLVQLHRQQRALRVGDFRSVEATALLAFQRCTERAAEGVLVLVNPAARAVRETVMLADSALMDGTPMTVLLGSDAAPGTVAGHVAAATLTLQLPARSFLVLQPDTAPQRGYTAYKRMP